MEWKEHYSRQVISLFVSPRDRCPDLLHVIFRKIHFPFIFIFLSILSFFFNIVYRVEASLPSINNQPTNPCIIIRVALAISNIWACACQIHHTISCGEWWKNYKKKIEIKKRKNIFGARCFFLISLKCCCWNKIVLNAQQLFDWNAAANRTRQPKRHTRTIYSYISAMTPATQSIHRWMLTCSNEWHLIDVCTQSVWMLWGKNQKIPSNNNDPNHHTMC